MRILHCCLAAFYIDNYGYQENILPQMHKLQGHDVAILASTETYINSSELSYLSPGSYLTKEGIPVTRLGYVNYLPHIIRKKLRIYIGISSFIKKFSPDIIFLHDCQFVSIYSIANYAKKNNVRIYVDGHTDFINSGRNWFSKNILHKIIYKWCAKKIEPYTRKFYGTLPLRSAFFRDVYGIDEKKVELLPLGADLTGIDLKDGQNIRNSLRRELDITETDFVIVTGGKLDRRKNIHRLLRIVNELNIEDIKVIVFGTATIEMRSEIEELSKSPNIKNIGWIDSENTFKFLLAADVAIFPGTHSVLWEQSIGLGIPCIFKKWKGMEHLNLNGNCLFIEIDEITELREKILLIYNNKNILANMKRVAVDKGIKEFSYFEIAKRAIDLDYQ